MVLGVAFVTVTERKIMASMQRRVGPNYVGIYGLLQPFADALKLILKESIIPQDAVKFLYLIAPIITLVLSLLLWSFVPLSRGVVVYDHPYSVLLSLVVGSLVVYGIILAGWASNSKYSFLGSIRSSAQVISYEIILTSCILMVLLFNNTLNFVDIVENQQVIINIFPLFFIFIIFMISILAETNRTPFDLPEAESELVSGFNTEFSAILFVLFFLAEYSNILYWSTITSEIFFGGFNLYLRYPLISGLWLGLKASFFVFVFIWVRATLPRLKFNQLMDLCWNKLIPWVFSLLCLGPSLFFLF